MKFLFKQDSPDVTSNNSKSVETQTPGLGTFGGVYTPSILTILGVIMYLRFGWVVGNVGLVGFSYHCHPRHIDYFANFFVGLRDRN